jgi:hypothetical protein
MKKHLLHALTAFVLVLSLSLGASAQTEVVSQDAQIYQLIPQNERIEELRQLYRDQVIAYREAERRFVSAKDQYQQLQTLLSLEEAVRETRSVYQRRAAALTTYLELLQVVFDETPGIDLARKRSVTQRLTAAITQLKQHEALVAVSEDRSSVNQRADEFDQLLPEVEFAAYEALSLLSHGRLQAVADQSRLVFDDIVVAQEDEEASSISQSQRQRAYKEIGQQLDEIQAQIKLIEPQGIDRDSQEFTRFSLQRVLSDLTPLHSKLARTITHLEELLRI